MISWLVLILILLTLSLTLLGATYFGRQAKPRSRDADVLARARAQQNLNW